jgi:hypothetical protein
MKSYKNDFEELKKIPQTSGLYYFYDENDDILYIGKANNLHSRTLAHYHNHSVYREMGFFVKIIELKGFSIKEKEKLPKELLDIWDNFIERDFSSSTLVIDSKFNKVKRIEIEEMSKELTESKEKEMIQKYKPPLNFETATDEYFEI